MNTLTTGDFVHLHNHTQYSLLDGLTLISPLMDHVLENGMNAVAMTDHGTLSGAIEFYKEGINHEVKPIIGLETYVATRKHTDKDPAKDKNRFHLILLAMNKTGYQNLMKLSTLANLDGFYYHPRIDRDLLEKYNEGLIVLSGCMSGEVGDALKQDNYKNAVEIAKWYKQVLGDRYYLEIQDHGHPDNPMTNLDQNKINKSIIKLSKELNIPAVVTSDAHYLNHSDQDAHEILLCVGTGSFLSDEKRMSLKKFPLHVTSPKEIIDRWGTQYPEFITNTRQIADRCHLELDLGNILIPKFPVPKGKTEKTYLHELVWDGVARKYSKKTQSSKNLITKLQTKKLVNDEVFKRAEYELGVIGQMGFNGYFLIIQDFINWGKKQGIIFGPGRGSAAGSIISYALNITVLDPLKYELLFERFLNPDRISMPDIDIDIQDTRRDEVIQYCVEKYGPERVANIVTFGRMQARNAVRDVARVLQVPYIEADRLAKMIPPPVQGRHIPLVKSIDENAELNAEYNSNETSKMVLDQAIKLEGTIRSHGVHAAGVVIAPDDIVKFAPLEMAQKGVVATQYSMGPIEELGLLKMDFLGLSNLTTINNALRIVKKVFKEDLSIEQIPLNDEKTYKLFQNGDTTGVFQFESAGMKRYLKTLKPTEFDDIVAMGALYRPGPMQWIDEFIARKHGQKAITYLHPAMEPALKNTYGIIVYQEQVMQISKELCGFSGGQADTLRKAIGKKNPDVMKKMKEEFIEGAVNTSNAERSIMEKFWTELEAFAAYAFPKAHAACYALTSYHTAYLKANYPTAFMAALMSSDFDDIDRLSIEITECKRMGIEVLPPDINESFYEFAVVPNKNQIRFGLRAIKNVGSNAVEYILESRDKHGHFKSIEEFLINTNSRTVNKKTIESLIKSGAFDKFANRSTLVGNIELIMAYASKIQKDANSGQTDLFGNNESPESSSKLNLNPNVPEINSREQLLWERELLGLYLSQHPLESYDTILSEKALPIGSLKTSQDGKMVNVGGAITDIREITTKNGQKMAFVKIEDSLDAIEIVLFPGIYQQTVGMWERDNVILVKGKISAKDKAGVESGEIKILVDDAREITYEQAIGYKATGKKQREPKSTKSKSTSTKEISEHTNIQPDRIYIRLKSTEDQNALLSIKKTIDEFPGETEVVLVIGDNNKQIIRLPNRISQKSGYKQLATVFGDSNVKI